MGGVHTTAGVSEAGFAIALNEIHTPTNHRGGLPESAMTMLALASPTYDDAHLMIESKPLMANRTFTMIDNAKRRSTMESVDGACHHLPDPKKESPRIHTNHALHADLQYTIPQGTSPLRLQRLAQSVYGCANNTSVHQLASWLAERDTDMGSDNENQLVTGAITILDPAERRLYASSGNKYEKMSHADLKR